MNQRPKGTGIVRIEVATGAQKVVFGEEAAQGFVTSYVVADDHTAWAIVGAWESGNPTSLVKFDPSTGERDPAWGPIRTPLYRLFHIQLAADDELLFVSDRTERAPGVRVLSTRQAALVGFLHSRVLPPMELLVLR
jgi:hypothetical protein